MVKTLRFEIVFEDGPMQYSAKSSGFYYVTLIDLMGQKAAVSEYEALSVGDPKSEEAFAKIEGEIRKLEQFRNTFTRFRTALKTKTKVNFPEQEQREVRESIRNCEMKFHYLSDCICIYGRVDSLDLFPSVAIFELFQGLSATMGMFLAMGLPFRGAMCIGPATEWGDEVKEIYGPALNLAYRLESNDTKWPRVVLDKSVESFLVKFKNSAGNDYRGRVHKAFAEHALEFITVDDQKNDFLDFAGIKFHEDLPDSQRENFKTFLNNALDRARNPDLSKVPLDKISIVSGYYLKLAGYLAQSKARGLF